MNKPCFLPRELKFSIANINTGEIVECNELKPLLKWVKLWAKEGNEIEILQATKEVKIYIEQVYQKYNKQV